MDLNTFLTPPPPRNSLTPSLPHPSAGNLKEQKSTCHAAQFVADSSFNIRVDNMCV
jgi:hypothetical protein